MDGALIETIPFFPVQFVRVCSSHFSPVLMESQARDMATLKEREFFLVERRRWSILNWQFVSLFRRVAGTVQMRLKSISNIAKITKSMKMIASSRMAKAQRLMDTARVYGGSDAGWLNLSSRQWISNC
jgi:hypothetical protein